MSNSYAVISQNGHETTGTNTDTTFNYMTLCNYSFLIADKRKEDKRNNRIVQTFPGKT